MGAEGFTEDAADLAQIRTDVDANTAAIALKAPLAAPSFTGGVTVADGLTVGSGVGEVIHVAMTSNVVVNNSTTLVDATGLAAAVTASGVYEVTTNILYDSATAADLKVAWAGLTGATFDWSSFGLTSVASSVSGSVNLQRNTFAGSVIVGGIGVGTTLVARPQGRLVVGTAGTLQFQFAQGTQDVSNTTVFARSALTLRRVA